MNTPDHPPKKKGAPKGNQFARKEKPMTGAFPRFRHFPETVAEVAEAVEKRGPGFTLADWLREAVDAKLDAESGAD